MGYNAVGEVPAGRRLEVVHVPAKASPRKLEYAVGDYVAGEACETAAARHGIGGQRLRSTLIERDLWRSRADMIALRTQHVSRSLLSKTPLPKKEIARRYRAGESINTLASSFGVSRSVISRRLTADGVTLRGNADANRLLAHSRSPEENRRLMLAAQSAVRGSTRSLTSDLRGARSRETSQAWLANHTSEQERQMAEWLRQRDLTVIPQKAIGPYNVDVAAGPVAVEIFGGGWHAYGAHRRRTAKRFGYILDQGWHLMIVWSHNHRWPLDSRAADEVVTFAEVARRDPSGRGEYRVIWGDGQITAAAGPDLDDLAVKPARGRGEGAGS